MSKYQFEKTIKKAYSTMSKDLRESLFPNGASQAIEAVTKLANVFYPQNNVNDLETNQVNYLIQFHADVYTRRIIMPGVLGDCMSTRDEGIIQKYSGIPENIVVAGIKISLGILYTLYPEAESRNNFLEQRAQMVAENAAKNVGIEDTYINDPDYGLVLEKPVFTAGFDDLYDYVARITDANDRELTYKRVGSNGVPGISGPVDIYHFYHTDGSAMGTIYMCCYGNATSKKAPQGYKLKGWSSLEEKLKAMIQKR